MYELMPFEPGDLQRRETVRALQLCNDLTAQYGLLLTQQAMEGLALARQETLRSTGRVELGEGILSKLIYAFCDSPYINQENYAETLEELQASFYYFKGEALELLDDDELIALMRRHFDTTCQGSLEYLSGTTLEELCRRKRFGEEDGEDLRPL